MSFRRLLEVSSLCFCVVLTALMATRPAITARATDRLSLAGPTPTPINEQFDVGGVTNFITYDMATASLKDRVIAAVKASVSIYQPLWDSGTNSMPFKASIALSAQKGYVDKQGRITRGETFGILAKQCLIYLYDDQQALENIGEVEFVILHLLSGHPVKETQTRRGARDGLQAVTP